MPFCGHTQSYGELQQIFEYGILVNVVLYQLAIAEFFVARLIHEKQLIPSVEPRGTMRPLDISQQLEELPGLLSELIDSANGTVRADCIQLASTVRVQLNEILHSPLRPDLSREISEGHRLIEQNELLMQQFLDKKEEANRQRMVFLQRQQSMVGQLRQHQRERDAVRSRVHAKTAELNRLKAACHFHREQIATLLTEKTDRTAPVVPNVEEPEVIVKADPSETPDLSVLSRQLREALELNRQLRAELAEDAPESDQQVDEFRGLIAVLRDDQDDEDDGLTDELQENIIQDVFRAFDVYKHADWTNPEEFRIASVELMRHAERLICLKKLKEERRRKLRNRIDALKQSVVTCKSALMGLLGDDLMEVPG
jgi:hypothetical protein